MSRLKLWLSRRDSLLDEEDECLSLDECLEEWLFDELDELDDLEDLLDLSWGTSRMFKTRPVVGSVVDD
jgi:hypothetical protein